jgi:hypothetical protein
MAANDLEGTEPSPTLRRQRLRAHLGVGERCGNSMQRYAKVWLVSWSDARCQGRVGRALAAGQSSREFRRLTSSGQAAIANPAIWS